MTADTNAVDNQLAATPKVKKSRSKIDQPTNVEKERRQAIHDRLDLFLNNPVNDGHLERLAALLIGWELEYRLRGMLNDS